MPWPPDIIGELPAPRDDEPSSLRQDIADELADHLHSSFNRELHFTPEESSAKHNVLDRFGDPRRIARQLWFDAMKEKIVSQRVQISALVVAIAACLGSTGLTWLLITQTREANQALLEQSQKVNTALLEKLATLAAPATAEPARSMDWNPAKIRLVKDVPGGIPAQGFMVRLTGHILDTAESTTVVRTTGADGLADFGPVRPGQHAIYVESPWTDWYRDEHVVVLPGKELNMELVCPGAARDEAPVSFSVDWPEEYRNSGLWLVCEATLAKRTAGGTTWNNAAVVDRRYFIVTNSGEAIALPDGLAVSAFQTLSNKYSPDHLDPFFRINVEPRMIRTGDSSNYEILPRFVGGQFGVEAWEPPAAAKPRSPIRPDDEPGPTLFRPVWLEIPPAASARELRWHSGEYTIENLVACDPPSDGNSADIRYVSVAGGLVAGASQLFQNIVESRKLRYVSDWLESSDPRPNSRADSITHAQRAERQPKFDAHGGRANHWTIVPPPRLLEVMRRYSAECEAAGRQSESAQRSRRQQEQTVKPVAED